MLQDTLGPGIQFSDDMKRSMRMDDMWGGFGGGGRSMFNFGKYGPNQETEKQRKRRERKERRDKEKGKKDPFDDFAKNIKIESHTYEMEEDTSFKFETVKEEKLQDLSHLFKVKDNQVYMITQEEYDKEQAIAKAKRKEKRELRKQVKDMLRGERKTREEVEGVADKFKDEL